MDTNASKIYLDQYEKSYIYKLLSEEADNKYDSSERMKEILDEVSIKILKKCKNEIEDLNKYLENDFLSEKEIKPYINKEKEAKEAYTKFYKCSYHPNVIINKLESINYFATKVNEEQFQLCKDDCYKKINTQNIEITKLCIKKCVDYSFHYTRKATFNIFGKILDNIEKEVKLL